MGSGTEKIKGHSRIRVITFVTYMYLESLNLSVVFLSKILFIHFLKSFSYHLLIGINVFWLKILYLKRIDHGT